MSAQWAIDVSGYDSRRYDYQTNGYIYDLPIDWKKGRDEGGQRLAIVKSSEGINYVDKAFKMNWKGAGGILPRAAYHFFRSNLNAITQAEFFVSQMKNSGFDPASDYAILDLETLDGMSGANAIAAAGSWLYEVEKRLGVRPMVYTYPSFWITAGGTGLQWASLKKYPLALAMWPKDTYILSFSPTIFTAPRLTELKYQVETCILTPRKLAPWDSPAIWQFTSRADTKAVPGHPAVKKVCDYNIVYMPLPGAGSGETQPPTTALGQYSCKSSNLWVFASPDSNTKITASLKYGQIVTVLQTVSTIGEVWAQVESPAGWCRFAYLVKA